MTANGIAQISLYLVTLVLVAVPLAAWLERVGDGRAGPLERAFGPLERAFYRLLGTAADAEQDWRGYAAAVLVFSAFSVLAVFALQELQGALPLNPQGFGAVAADSALNTAVSFVTNTNWQGYGGESTLSYLTQMLGLAVQNFLSAAVGLAVMLALFRGFSRRETATLGNFWVDLTRATLYVLLPLAFVLALALAAQGVVQTFAPYVTATLLEPTVDSASGQPLTGQVIALGPVASQLAIKHLGTNGGGFFNANASHPYENPTALTDFLLVLAQTALPAACALLFGRVTGDRRQGWAILAAMLIVLAVALFAAYAAESAGNPRIAALGVDQQAGDASPGGNLEGKEVRFGIARSALFAVTTTATSCGAVNGMHDSFTPLGGLVPLALMQFSETILGGVGAGMYGMLVFVIVAVFVAGLMVGRTPEYLGKKIEPFEMKMAAIVVLLMPAVVLLPTAVAAVTPAALASLSNPGAHGFAQVLYAFTSMGNNNGSAFAGLNANTPFYNLLGAAVMLLGRFGTIVPVLAIAGSLAAKKTVPAGPGTLPTHTPLFVGFLIGTVVIVGALTFFPVLALGPLVEQLQLAAH
ncbi:K+-transporting ATPase ATPase A chain [Plasticicumulans lactativorans]|uniref:Potassium-transporting ATPase potassium-binding subunit n=1 Tax=Plasticicumulans lactativorans TaxID=1133106 RepID=A0A4R2L7C8_9GAMM|nr:potassium-transporting ATPase subunit KdpA [Plasticicumulans lactativorans]TCO81210.1 K+-transporting ATPase ATPase A chain [Plasticicumulans lactativorans]